MNINNKAASSRRQQTRVSTTSIRAGVAGCHKAVHCPPTRGLLPPRPWAGTAPNHPVPPGVRQSVTAPPAATSPSRSPSAQPRERQRRPWTLVGTVLALSISRSRQPRASRLQRGRQGSEAEGPGARAPPVVCVAVWGEAPRLQQARKGQGSMRQSLSVSWKPLPLPGGSTGAPAPPPSSSGFLRTSRETPQVHQTCQVLAETQAEG